MMDQQAALPGFIATIDSDPVEVVDFGNGSQAWAPVVPATAPKAPPVPSSPCPQVVPHARPQVANGREFWAEHWGVTRAQLRSLLKRLRRESTWKRTNNVYTLVSDFVVPWTQGRGLGFALLINQEEPKEVNLMVSHAWSENAEEFLEVLVRATSDTDVMFICALSIFQAGDGSGPSLQEQIGSKAQDSPLFRVLENMRQHVASNTLVWLYAVLRVLLAGFLILAVFFISVPIIIHGCVPSVGQCAEYGLLSNNTYDFVWQDWDDGKFSHGFARRCFTSSIVCIVASVVLWVATHLILPYVPKGRLVVVPNREAGIFFRLWCVYEIFMARSLGVPVTLAPTLASCGTCSAGRATCSDDGDMRRIRAEIEQLHGREGALQLIDAANEATTRETELKAVLFACSGGVPQAVLFIAFYRLYHSQDRDLLLGTGDELNIAFMIALGTSLSVGGLFHMLQRAQGRPTCGQVFLFCVLLLSLSLVFAFLSVVPGSASIAVWQASQEVLAWFFAGILILSLIFWTSFHARRPLYRDAGFLIMALLLFAFIYTAVRLNRGQESRPTFCFSAVLGVYGAIGLLIAIGSLWLSRVGLQMLGGIILMITLLFVQGVPFVVALAYLDGDSWSNYYPWLAYHFLRLLCFVSFPAALCYHAISFWGIALEAAPELPEGSARESWWQTQVQSM